MNNRLQNGIVRISTRVKPLLIIALFGLIVGFLSPQLTKLRFDYNIDSFFARNDPEVEFYVDFKEKFENENNYLLIGIKNNEGVFTKVFLDRIDSLTNQLKSRDKIIKVYSPTNLSNFVNVPILGITQFPIIHLDDQSQFQEDKNRIYASSDFSRSFFSKDTLSVQVLLKVDKYSSPKEGNKILKNIETIIAQHDFDEWHTAGRLRTQQFYISEMKSEMQLFASLTFLILIVSLWIVLKRLKYMLWVLAVLLVALLLTFALIGFLNYPINLMITLLPAILLITGTSGSVHILSKFKEHIATGKDKEHALHETIKEAGVPVFFNALTTAIGFASLWLIPVEPIQKFGLLTAMGILVTYFTGMLLLPALILQFERSKTLPKIDKTARLPILYESILQQSLKVKLATLLFFIIGLGGITNISINNFFLDDLHEKSSLKQDLAFFEKNFNGIRPFELVITAKDNEKLESEEVVKEIDILANYLTTKYEIQSVTSLSLLIKSVNKTMHGGNSEHFKIPSSKKELNKVIQQIKKRNLETKFIPLIDSSWNSTRISGRSQDWGSTLLSQKNKNLLAFVNKELQHVNVQITGAAYLMDRTNLNITSNLLLGISFAILISSLCVFLLTRSIKLALISIIPNALPLVFAGMVLWIFGITFKIGTAMVFTIIYGLAVDDTMHFLYNFQEIKKGTTSIDALKKTYLTVKKPMTHTTIVLSLGFLVFSGSQFTSISTIGVLISSSLIVALLADFTVLPAFLISKKE